MTTVSTRGKETVDNNKKVEKKRLERNGRRERGRINDRFGSLPLAYTISIVASYIPKYIERCSHARTEQHFLDVLNFHERSSIPLSIYFSYQMFYLARTVYSLTLFP